MIQTLKKNKLVFNMVWFFRRMMGITPEKLNDNFHKKRQYQLIQTYFANNQALRKLQIGAQNNSVEDWLNVDILPKNNNVAYLDATQNFPFQNASFDYVFSEHMIEHIDFEEGKFMLQECFRVLKPQGKIRIATPDLANLAKLIHEPESERSQKYIQHYIERFYDNQLPLDPTYLINKLFYSFHHKFIHSESSLRYLLNEAGFSNFKKVEVYQSEDENLRNLEQHGNEMGEEINKIETIVVEAQKP